ncbi:MAG: hypothetical protein H0U46_11055, partial [Actinobacteria bacterium]|nr:hypothetical protein [Actinomycetota bacterium]
MSRAKPSVRSVRPALVLTALATLVVTLTAGTTQAGPSAALASGPVFTEPAAFDVSPPLTQLVSATARVRGKSAPTDSVYDADRDLSVEAESKARRAISRLAAPQAAASQAAASAIPAPSVNFEGLSNQDNFNVFGFRVNPPDPVGDVGRNHYVEMINLVFGVYSKTGTLLLGPVDTGTLWTGFPIEDCTDPSRDPIVVYDQTADRWLLTQFTTRGLDDPTLPFYNCVAISQTGDPTGAYYRYAFSTGLNFPDYPKYGVYGNSYIITDRQFGPTVEYGIGVHALERAQMIKGNPNARYVSFFIDGNDPSLLPLVGDGLLPPDMDGPGNPRSNIAPIVGTQDDDYVYGATSDALNVWELNVKWARRNPQATLVFKVQLPVNEFDSNFPCAPTARDCLPQPGIVDPAQYLDILSYRQRPTWRLAYRKMQGYETLVTNQSVEVRPGIAGVRWYEIRRTLSETYTVHQQGDYSPDNVHRWMGSIAMDRRGNAALGYSVVDGTSVYPGIRYAGRLATD